MATTTNKYYAYPALANGITVTSGTSWANGSWTQIVPASTITTTFYITGLTWSFIGATATATTYEFLFELATGAAASEVSIIQVPASLRNITASGYLPTNLVMFPEPVQVSANTRISCRISNGSTTAYAIPAVKIFYQAP
jgi:hypothetical protein